MNPFNMNREYDEKLSQILTKINKKAPSPHVEALNELYEYLPNVDLRSDAAIILKSLKPLFSCNYKNRVNMILLEMLKTLDLRYFKSIMTEWTYENIDSEDIHSKIILQKYFDVGQIADELADQLKWEDSLKDLKCFLVLMERGCKEYYFDVRKLTLNTHVEFDLLYKVLYIIKSKHPGKVLHDRGVSEGSYIRIAREAFETVRSVRSDIFTDRKYNILLDIYDYVGDEVYEECAHLGEANLNKILLKDIEYDRLSVNKTGQMIMVYPMVNDKKRFIAKNINTRMCIFRIIASLGIDAEFMRQQQEMFVPVVNESIRRHFILRSCTEHPASSNQEDDIKKLIGDVVDVCTGKYRIVVCSMLDMQISPQEFAKEDIEDVFPYSTNVFPIEYFFTEYFSADASSLLSKYPKILQSHGINEILERFSRTKLEGILSFVDDPVLLKPYFDQMSTAEIMALNKQNINRNLDVLFYYYLRDGIDAPQIDYSIVFKGFLSKEFLKFLINRNCNREALVESICEYIRGITIHNSIYFTGYNFDDDPSFYYNLSAPEIDIPVEMFYSVFSSIRCKGKEEILRALMGIILYKKVEIEDVDMSADEIRSIFNFGPNNFIVERFIREFVNIEPARCSLRHFRLNRNKAVDVILRNVTVEYRRLGSLNPTYLSNEALRGVVMSILNKSNTSLKTKDFYPLIPDLEGLGLHESLDVGHPTDTDALIDEYFPVFTGSGMIDFSYLPEKDRNLLDKKLRADRLEIYNPLIEMKCEEVARIIAEDYSFSRLEENLNNDDVFDFILDVLKSNRFTFWSILCRSLYKMSNIYTSLFVEKMIINYLSNDIKRKPSRTEGTDLYDLLEIKSGDAGTNYFEKNSIIGVHDYLMICTEDERAMFGMSLPNLFNKMGFSEILKIEPLLRNQTEYYIENARFSLSKSKDSHTLRMIYRADSIVHEANVVIPLEYPGKRARIEFEHKSPGSTMFYHKLNELLSKTSKFVDILTLWKVDIDNHIAGYTECLICYFVMEPVSRTLPDFKCGTCKSNYHKRCIFKWIGESRNSLCPICRTEMHVWE